MSNFGVGDFIRDMGAKAQPPEQFGFVEEYAKYLDAVLDERHEGFHISQLWRFCPLRWVLERVFRRQRKIPFALRYRLDVGHALHEMVQRHLAGMGILKGFWRCDQGHETTEISCRPPKCASCGSEHIRYREIRVGHEVEPGFRIVGRTDGVVCWKGEDMGLEVKSVDPKRFAFLGAPDAYPVFQLNLYMKLLRDTYFQDLRKGIILYVSWPSAETILLPARSFVVDYSDGPWEEAASRVREAISLWKALETTKTLTVPDLITKRTCRSEAEGRRAECPVSKECFSTALLSQAIEKGLSR